MAEIRVRRCIVRSKNKHKLLLLRRAAHNKTNPGKWECPGGKDGLVDEISEETGLDVVIRKDREPRVVDASTVAEGELAGTTFITDFVIGTDMAKDKRRCQVRLDIDHDECVWVGIDEALTYDLTLQTRKGLLAWEKEIQALEE